MVLLIVRCSGWSVKVTIVVRMVTTLVVAVVVMVEEVALVATIEVGALVDVVVVVTVMMTDDCGSNNGGCIGSGGVRLVFVVIVGVSHFVILRIIYVSRKINKIIFKN